MSIIDTSSMIAPGPIVGGGWDAVVRACESAIATVNPASRWVRITDARNCFDALDPRVAIGFEVISLERATLTMPGLTSIAIAHVHLRTPKGRISQVRADRFLREFTPLRVVQP